MDLARYDIPQPHLQYPYRTFFDAPFSGAPPTSRRAMILSSCRQKASDCAARDDSLDKVLTLTFIDIETTLSAGYGWNRSRVLELEFSIENRKRLIQMLFFRICQNLKHRDLAVSGYVMNDRSALSL